MITKKWMLMILFPALLFCQKTDYDVKVKIENGIKHIINPRNPQEGSIKCILKEELSIGVFEGDDNYIFNNPYRLKVNRAGDIFVFDWGDIRIQVYDKNGKYLRTIGRRGKGPGEFEGWIYLSIGWDGKTYVLDGLNRRVSIFDAEGQYEGGFNFEGFHENIGSDQANRIYLGKVIQDFDYSKATQEPVEYIQNIHILRVDSSGSILHDYGKLTGSKEAIAQGNYPGQHATIVFHNRPTGVWDVKWDGTLYYGYNEKFLITVFDHDGKIKFKFGRVCKPIKNLNYEGKAGDSKYIPEFAERFLFDEEGNIWIELYRLDEEENIKYDIFSPGGIYLKQISVEHPIYALKKGKAYSIVETEEGFKVVKRFDLLQ